MKPPLFAYEDPRSLDDALAVLARGGDEVSILSGGQSLMPLLNMRLARPEILLDVNRVPGLDTLRVTDDAIEAGTLVRARALERDGDVRRRLPVIGSALSHVGHPQIRARTTVGGNIAHADPSSELPGVLALLEGAVELTSARGSRWVGWDDFFVTVFTTARESDELVTKVRFPTAQGWDLSFDEFAPRHGDFPIVALALGTQVQSGVLTGLRIAVTGVSDRVRRLTETEALARGGRFDRELVREICASARAEVDPTGDSSGSTEYRRYLLGTLLERQLTAAIETPAA
ncbi:MULTISPECIES: FAD binding domain-containing protein [unclassified Nocardioides]|uniref:FAD binding domain-containing protein n=1 Tax=unclassified Nocardioides TaxID=2615069 RepID=UPI003611D8AD